MALKHTNTHSRASTACKPHGTIHGHVATHAFAQCLGSSLVSGILAWITPVLIGAGVGALIGLLLASLIRLGRASKPAAGATTSPTPPSTTDAPGQPAARER